MQADVEKTQQYYRAMPPEDLCDCAHCRNFYAQIRQVYPDFCAFLEKLGVDPQKPHELVPIELDGQSICYAGCMYVVMGVCEDDFTAAVGEVEITKADAYPPTEIAQPHFVLEGMPIVLPLRLPQEERPSGRGGPQSV